MGTNKYVQTKKGGEASWPKTYGSEIVSLIA